MKKQKGYTTVELIMALYGLIIICIAAGILYVIFHFVGKFW